MKREFTPAEQKIYDEASPVVKELLDEYGFDAFEQPEPSVPGEESRGCKVNENNISPETRSAWSKRLAEVEQQKKARR